MARKSAGATSNSTNNPPIGVDFLFRTMLERESTGKRQIRPKNVEDLFAAALGDESDDPDYEEADNGSVSNSDLSDDDTSQGSTDSNEDSDDDTSNSDSSDEASSDSADSDDENTTSAPKEKKSALRETLQKINDTTFETKKRKKKKKKIIRSANAQKSKKVPASKNTSVNSSTDAVASSTSRKRSASEAALNLKSKAPKSVKFSQNKAKPKTKDKAKVKSKKLKRKKEKGRKSRKSRYTSISSLLDGVSATLKENRKELDATLAPICSACLGDKSDESNEIVSCDFCGITVHEGCYGIGDSLSVSSGSGSSCSTEPWFCDACKNGAEKITCDLCPTVDGLFKETSNGRWVHVVCAIYTPGVGLGDPDNPPNIGGVRYRWGTHTCSQCKNEKYATTGVPIQCDAGLCKTYIHASCAQKAGLLSDYTQVDSLNPEADPYYAACRMHTNRELAKRRAESFRILQEQIRVRKEKKDSDLTPFEKTSQNRIAEKLLKIRRKNSFKRSKTQIQTLAPYPLLNAKDVQRKSRYLHTSTSVGDMFLVKAELLGEDVKYLEMEDRNERIVTNVKRKWNVQPALGVEFAAYYKDREARISSMAKQCETLEQSNLELNDKQIALKNAWDTHCHNNIAIAENTDEMRTKIEGLKTILQELGTPNKKFISVFNAIGKSNEQAGHSRRSPARSTSLPNNIGNMAKKSKMMKLLTPSHLGRLSMVVKCDVCHKSEGQHLITNCDECKKNYHLSCLDPPLTRLPKRTRLQGWVCSDCNDVDSQGDDDSKEPQVDTDAPRTLRGRTNIKKPGKYRNSDESEDDEAKIIYEKLNVDQKPNLATLSQMSPEVKIIADVSPNVMNGGVRSSSRRRSGGGSTLPNASGTSLGNSPSLSSIKSGNVNSPVLDSNTIKTAVAEIKNKSLSPSSAIKKRSNKKVKKIVVKHLINSKQGKVASVNRKRKSKAEVVTEKPALVLTIRKSEDGSNKTETKQKYVDNVTAIIMENSVVKPTPLGASPLNSKNKTPPSNRKQKISYTSAHSLTPDQKSVPLKKRRRLSSAHTPLSEKSGLQNSNGPLNFKNTVVSSGNTKSSTGDSSGGLKIKVPQQPTLGKADNSVDSLVANNNAINSSNVCNFTPGLLSVNTPLGQTNTSPNHVALVDLSKNSKFNRERMEKEPSLLSPTGALNSQSQNHMQLPFGIDVADSTCSLSQDSLSLISGMEGKCDTCGKEDLRRHLVTCDKCRMDFHFMCLEPPLKYSPKRRGYSWFCANCDETSSTDSKTENDVIVT